MLPTKENLEKRQAVINKLKSKLIESLDLPYAPDDISEDVPLVGSGLGIDSLGILDIVLCIEDNFGVKVPQLNTEILRSFNTLVDFIMKEQEANNA